MYERDELREYIKNSELRIFNKKIKIRLSSELAKKYDKGIYTNYLIRLQKELEMLDGFPSSISIIFCKTNQL